MPTIRPPLTQTQAIAQHWQGGVNDSVVAGWLQTFHDPQLQSWVAGALADNFSLAEQRTIVAQAKQQWIAQGARIFPELELSSAARRTKAVSTDQSTTLNKELQIAIGINWELDLWGKLRASEREANLAFAAQRAQLQATELDTVAAIGTAWYEHLSAYAQLQLLEKRLHNLTQGLEIIEAGYRKGIHQALDVYLARNEVHQEHARVAAQARLSSESARALHLLVAQYPIDRIAEPPALPVLDTPIPVGVPSALLSRRPDLQAAWLALLAADAQVALRHKQRFPSLVLSGNRQCSLEPCSRPDPTAI